ncbi:hypothetical protein A2U01_0043612 [Trifolium medium]|uniref:Uncharacterized protein n=1 Tax=Trifolium medium TaxID=97028 RepID=A0A392QFW8_9FABA|nr:hypothetical protein [Trifolium medium]
MLGIIFVGKAFQAHLLVMDPQMHPICSAKGSFKESSETSPVQHKGILENIPMFDTTSRDKTSSHHAHARA